MGLAKRTFLRLNWIANQLGFYPIQFVGGLASLPRYLMDRHRFRRSLTDSGLSTRVTAMPALHDIHATAGELGEYFWQDLTVARMVLEAEPRRHLDVGSRIDGFVGHLAINRRIEVIDIRPMTEEIPNVVFRQADMMGELPVELIGCCDSLSCLHTIEHFGLGRYGDPIDAKGLETGITNLARVLELGGTLYLSTPIGRPRVEFNAHRVSDPREIRRIASESGLTLARFFSIESNKVKEHPSGDEALSRFAGLNYSLGIFVFTRPAS